MNVRISGSLDHDGDGIVRYHVLVTSNYFSAATQCWGNADEVLKLADSLSGFPYDHGVPLCFRFGSEKSGCCDLRFVRIDAQGHCGVWVDITAEAPVYKSQDFEKASVFIPIEPVGIDEFVSSLRRFHSRASNEAILSGAEA